MGKTNLFTVVIVAVLQLLVGSLWYGPHLFGDFVTTSGHSVSFLKTDMISMILLFGSSYGLTYIFDLLISHLGVKGTNGGVKLGLTLGTFAIGLPLITLLNLMGIDKIVLLVILAHVILISSLTGVVVLKLKKV